MDYCDGMAMETETGAWSAAGDAWTGDWDMVPLALNLGLGRLDRYRAGLRGAVQIAVRPGAALLIVALGGSAEVVGSATRIVLDDDAAALIAQPGTMALRLSPGAEVAVVQATRARVQVLVSRSQGDPVRLNPVNTVLPAPALRAALADDLGGDAAAEDLLETVLALALAGHPERAAILPVARAVREAMLQIRNNAEGALDAASLAGKSGVTQRTLREGFRACLGLPLSQYIQEAQLRHARSRLVSQRDSRSIAEIAVATGFGSSSSFSRAYARAFGETPTQTRMRSFDPDSMEPSAE